MQGGLDEFLAARDCDDDDDNNKDGANGPEIAVRSCAASRASGAASIAAVSIGAASLGVQFRTPRRTLEEINRGEIIACKQDCGLKGTKIYVAIRKAATTPLPDKLLGPRFLGAKNKDGEQSGHKASRLFNALDFFGEMPLTMPAQYSNKVEDMVPMSSR